MTTGSPKKYTGDGGWPFGQKKILPTVKLQCGEGGTWGLMTQKHLKHKKVTFLLAFVGLILFECVILIV
jgi:hypothetical protein